MISVTPGIENFQFSRKNSAVDHFISASGRKWLRTMTITPEINTAGCSHETKPIIRTCIAIQRTSSTPLNNANFFEKLEFLKSETEEKRQIPPTTIKRKRLGIK